MHELNALFVGLGPLGRLIAADFVARRFGRIAGAADPAPDIAGRHVGQIVPGAESFLTVARSIDEALSRAAPKPNCAIVATSSSLPRCMPALRSILAAGISIVSTCEELLFPWPAHEGLAAELDSLARRHGARILGTGVNPGFLMDTWPVFMTAVCREVRALRASRIQDATTRRIPFQQKIGAGLDDAAFKKKVAEGSLRHVGLRESAHFIAHYLGLEIAHYEETIDPVRAERDMTCDVGPISRGGISGVRQTASATNNAGKPVVSLEFIAAIGQSDPHDRVVIDSDPPIDATIRGGVHGDTATSAIALNSIRPLLAAPPGLHTMATIALPHFSR